VSPGARRDRALPHALVAALALGCGAAAGPPAQMPAPPPAACAVGGLYQDLGRSRLIVGYSGDDAVAALAPFDLRYEYLAGQLFDGAGPCASCATGCTAAGVSCANAVGCGWWGCWQYDQVPPGQYAEDLVARAGAHGEIPMFTYYLLLPASGVAEGEAEATVAARDRGFMSRYLADWRFLLRKIGTASAFLHVEPDFWGYAQHAAVDGGTGAHGLPAAVASANPADCSGFEESIAGLGRCMIAMVRKYAPNARVGLHASGWGTKIDVLLNRNASLDAAGEGAKLGRFLVECGAGYGDFVVADMSDRDAGWYQVQNPPRDTWWDETNAALPHFHQAFTWARAVSLEVGRPVLWWQIPVGNVSLPNATGAWRDNRVDYLLAHASEAAASGAFGLAFGAGAAGQTTPSSDGGNLVARTNAYAASAGAALCP
jgi:hypothetical protein